MSRDLTNDVIAQITSGHVRPCCFAFLDFEGDPAYIWSGIGTINWNGHDWIGLGSLGSISAVPETSDTKAQNIVLTLSGIPTSLLADAISAVQQDTLVQLWFGFLNDDNTVVADPYQVFYGHLDVPTVTEGADTSSISITCENPLVDLQRASNRRLTPDDQRIDYPTDKGFDYVASIQSWSAQWGKTSAGVPNNSGSTGSGPNLLAPYYNRL